MSSKSVLWGPREKQEAERELMTSVCHLSRSVLVLSRSPAPLTLGVGRCPRDLRMVRAGAPEMPHFLAFPDAELAARIFVCRFGKGEAREAVAALDDLGPHETACPFGKTVDHRRTLAVDRDGRLALVFGGHRVRRERGRGGKQCGNRTRRDGCDDVLNGSLSLWSFERPSGSVMDPIIRPL